MDPTVLINIIYEAILAIIKNCPDEEDRLVKRMRRFGLIERLRVESEVRRQLGPQWSENRAQVRSLISDAHADATDDDLREMVAMGRAA